MTKPLKEEERKYEEINSEQNSLPKNKHYAISKSYDI